MEWAGAEGEYRCVAGRRGGGRRPWKSPGRRGHRRLARRPDRQPIGASLDDEDRERAYAAQLDALDRGQSGAPVSWKNPDSGRYGTVVPGPAYVENGRNCRSYTHTIYIDGRPQTARGTACRNPDGSWTALS